MTQLKISAEKLIEQIKLSGHFSAVIEGIASRELVFSTAANKGVSVSSEELQQGADHFRLAQQLYKPEDTWRWLRQHSLSLEQFEGLIHYQVLSGKLAKYLFETQVEPFFIANQLDYTKAAVYEVFLKDVDLATELYYALSEQEVTFPDIAHQYIEDVELRRIGGYRGLLSRKKLKPEISAAVFAASPPQILKPIVTASGVSLVYVEEIIPANLDETLRQVILNELFSSWLKQQLSQLEILVEDPLFYHNTSASSSEEITPQVGDHC